MPMVDFDMESGESTEYRDGVHTFTEPPETLQEILKFLGPSFAIVAVTVGSGELIATTAAGAQVGIVALWFLILSLLIKVGLQYGISRDVLVNNRTPHELFDEVPGQLFNHSWVYWWVVLNWIIVENILYMGVFFGAGTLLYHIFLQSIPIQYLLLVLLVATIYPSLKGYDFVENLATVIVLSLVVITLLAAGLSFYSPYALSVDQIVYGLSFHLPNSGIAVVFGTIGLTGITAVELIGYALFVQESGYRKLAGPREVDGWEERISGWLRVLKVDVIVSVLLTVVVTIAFFIVGATVVSGVGQYPSGPELGLFLANAYEQLFGSFGYWILLIGGFFAMYSTIFGKTQIIAVAWPDWIGQTHWGKDISRERISTAVTVILPIAWYVGGYILGEITSIIILGGIFSTMTLVPEIATLAWILRNEENQDSSLRMTKATRVGIWISLIGTLVMVASVLTLTIL